MVILVLIKLKGEILNEIIFKDFIDANDFCVAYWIKWRKFCAPGSILFRKS